MFELAKTVQLETKAVLDHCRDLGFDVKNQLSSLEREQVDALKGRIFGGEQPDKSPTPVLSTSPSTLKAERKVDTLLAPQKTEANDPNSSVVRVLARAVVPVRCHYLPQENPGIEKLLDIGEKTGLGELYRIPQLSEIDLECAVFKIRQVTERLCKKVLKVDPQRQPSLDDMISEIRRQKFLPGVALTYLDLVRNLGNDAAHNTNELLLNVFTDEEVNFAANALANVLRAVFNKFGRI